MECGSYFEVSAIYAPLVSLTLCGNARQKTKVYCNRQCSSATITNVNNFRDIEEETLANVGLFLKKNRKKLFV